MAHDDSHTVEDWVRFITGHAERAEHGAPQDARQHLIKVGGLALSAVLAMDRKAGRQPGKDYPK